MEKAIGLMGAALIVAGVFVPALNYPTGLHPGLWDAHRWTAASILSLAGLAIFLLGNGRKRATLAVTIVTLVLVTFRLSANIYFIESSLTENALLSQREAGWASLFRMGIPRVDPTAWCLLYCGGIMLLPFGLSQKKSRPDSEASSEDSTASEGGVANNRHRST